MKLIKTVSLIFGLLFLFNAFLSAGPSVSESDASVSEEPKPQKKQDYAGIFKSLDGKWEGKFYVYSSPRGQSKKKPLPRGLSVEMIKKIAGKPDLTIDVRQHYTSESPYYQRVRIVDTYTRPDGSKREEVSTGFNKVENGVLICVVNKPNEKVVHRGRTEGTHTIIWERHLKEPLKIEYFRETVKRDSYTILGWGYYGTDNPELGPKTWFYGNYTRVKQKR